MATACLLAFSGFLRFDELIHIRACDITIDGVMAKIHIPRSKTDQFRQSSEVVIVRSSSKTCLVNMVECYMSMAALDKDSKQLLFREITSTKAGEKLRPSGGLSYTTLRELFKKKQLSELGYPSEQFGLHSLRSGGATAAATAGVPGRLFKKHVRWKSENAKDGYVEDSLDSWFSVSRQKGLWHRCIFCSFVCARNMFLRPGIVTQAPSLWPICLEKVLLLIVASQQLHPNAVVTRE